MDWHKDNKGEPIRLIGHSHGGNVAILIVNHLSKLGMKVDTLITIGTPVRGDYQLEADVGQHLNVYNNWDGVQVLGGSIKKLGGAKRKFSEADNVKVELPFWLKKEAHLISNHSYMHNNISVWEKYIEPNLK